MGNWTKTSPVTSTGAGVLRPELLAAHADLARHSCHPSLEGFVENYWSLRWDLPEGASYQSQTLPHPACTLSVERGHTRTGVGHDPVVLTGVVTRRFDVTVAGHAWVFAAKFRPGGLAAMMGQGVAALRDRVVPAARYLPSSMVRDLDALDDTVSLEDCVACMDAALRSLDVPEDPRYDQVLAIIADMLGDRSIVRVEQLQERHSLSVRSIQRLFDHYVGVGPKWVLARYRIHDALTDLDAGYEGRLADLAASLGWYDEAHFSRDFTALVGESPGRYRMRRAESGRRAQDSGS